MDSELTERIRGVTACHSPAFLLSAPFEFCTSPQKSPGSVMQVPGQSKPCRRVGRPSMVVPTMLFASGAGGDWCASHPLQELCVATNQPPKHRNSAPSSPSTEQHACQRLRLRRPLRSNMEPWLANGDVLQHTTERVSRRSLNNMLGLYVNENILNSSSKQDSSARTTAQSVCRDVLGDTDAAVAALISRTADTLLPHTRTVNNVRSEERTSCEAVGEVCIGSGGVYRLGVHSVFKPRAEEAKMQSPGLAVGDPHPLRQGIQIGDGAVREVAAYQLDRAAGHFARVPPTTLASLRRDVLMRTRIRRTPTSPSSSLSLSSHQELPFRVEGSLQQFCESQGSSEDFGSALFALGDIQAVSLLDIRLFNTDRHGGNLLVAGSVDSSGKKRLIPIDHGLCLPAFPHLGEFEAEWLGWRQSRQPFTAVAKQHVQRLDPDRDATILRRLGVRERCVFTMQLLTHFLRFVVLTLDWDPQAIGTFLTRSQNCIANAKVGTVESRCGTACYSEFEALLRRAAISSGEPSMVGFVRGDESVPFSVQRARVFLAAVKRQWTIDL